jgi:NTE family protein
MRKYILFLILTVTEPFAFLLYAQSVGLVLSGGGAKGLTHIGVIKAIEENNIPIDYIGGSSMGAIIGAMYAMGYTPEEMIEIVDSEDFENWYTGTIKEKYRYYFKQETETPELVSIGFDLRDTVPKTEFPLSIIPNKIMDFVFMELFSMASAAANNNFDSLFVPFLCIGTDISYNREVVFRSGDLNQAVRASMTFPLYFRPITVDSSIMYDGGIYNNFPMDRMIEAFQPDVIIGSKAAETNKPPDEKDLIAQLENMVMKPADYAVPPDLGVLIDNSASEGSLLSFGRLHEFVEEGYQNTLDSLERIRQLIQRRAPDPEELQRMRASYRATWPELAFDTIHVRGVDSLQMHYIERSIRRDRDTLNVDLLREEYLKLAYDSNIDYLYPRAIYRPNDRLYTLDLLVNPRTPLEADIGLYFSTAGQTQTFLGFNYRNLSEVSTQIKGNLQFGQLYNGAGVGIRFDYPFNTPLFFDASVQANRLDYNQRASDFFFSDERQSYIIKNEVNFRGDVGVPYSTTGILKGGLGVARIADTYYPVQDFSSEDTADVSVLNSISLYAAIKQNTLDDRQYEKDGQLRNFSVRGGYGTEQYSPGNTLPDAVSARKAFFWANFKFEEKSYIKLNRKVNLGYYFSVNYALKPLLNNYSSTLIEAPVFDPNALTKSVFLEKFHAYQYIAAGLMPVYDINYLINLKLEAYVFMPMRELLRDENNNAYYGNYFERMYPMVNASVNFRTPLGPVTLHAGYLGGEQRPWIVKLSFGYLIFNKLSTDL